MLISATSRGRSAYASMSMLMNIRLKGRPPRQVEAPPLFPPTFLYNSSWEDPEKDMAALHVGPGDACLTLTSGGCNALNLCLQVSALPGPSLLFGRGLARNVKCTRPHRCCGNPVTLN